MFKLLINFLYIPLTSVRFTMSNRKVLASIQRRKGTNVTGFLGTLQAIADGLKLIFNKVVIPVSANWVLLLAATSVTLLIGLLSPYYNIKYLFLPFLYTIYFIAIHNVAGLVHSIRNPVLLWTLQTAALSAEVQTICGVYTNFSSNSQGPKDNKEKSASKQLISKKPAAIARSITKTELPFYASDSHPEFDDAVFYVVLGSVGFVIAAVLLVIYSGGNIPESLSEDAYNGVPADTSSTIWKAFKTVLKKIF